jgi:hypothetical protein
LVTDFQVLLTWCWLTVCLVLVFLLQHLALDTKGQRIQENMSTGARRQGVAQVFPKTCQKKNDLKTEGTREHEHWRKKTERCSDVCVCVCV